MTVQVSRLDEADVDGAITCIQEAFVADPYNNWVFDQKNFSFPRNRASLRTRCIWGIRNALFYVAKDSSSHQPDQVLGIACWLPPALARSAPLPMTWSEYAWSFLSPAAWQSSVGDWSASWSLWFNQLMTNFRFGGRGGLIARRYFIWKDAQSKAQAELWDDREGYYFCNIVTVLPGAQGKGIGKALMNVVLDKADAEGRKSYLESSRFTPNCQIYETMGFQLVREMKCKDGDSDEGINLYCMMREPKQADSSRVM